MSTATLECGTIQSVAITFGLNPSGIRVGEQVCVVGGGGGGGNNQHNPQYANYWAPLTRKRHIPPHSAQPRHTNRWAPRTRKRHPQEHRPQRPTERSDPTQHAKGRAGDCPGPRKETTTRRNVTQGGGGATGVSPVLQVLQFPQSVTFQSLLFCCICAGPSHSLCMRQWTVTGQSGGGSTAPHHFHRRTGLL